MRLWFSLLLLVLVPALAGKPPAAEHRLEGEPRPWTRAARQLVENPTARPAHQTAEMPAGSPQAGLKVYEYLNLKLGDRTFETVLLATRPGAPDDFVLELTPGTQGPPIQPEELGEVELLGEGTNYWVFRILRGPFAGAYLVWSTATGHRGTGGEAVRIYSQKALAREAALARLLER